MFGQVSLRGIFIFHLKTDRVLTLMTELWHDIKMTIGHIAYKTVVLAYVVERKRECHAEIGKTE